MYSSDNTKSACATNIVTEVLIQKGIFVAG